MADEDEIADLFSSQNERRQTRQFCQRTKILLSMCVWQCVWMHCRRHLCVISFVRGKIKIFAIRDLTNMWDFWEIFFGYLIR